MFACIIHHNWLCRIIDWLCNMKMVFNHYKKMEFGVAGRAHQAIIGIRIVVGLIALNDHFQYISIKDIAINAGDSKLKAL